MVTALSLITRQLEREFGPLAEETAVQAVDVLEHRCQPAADARLVGGSQGHAEAARAVTRDAPGQLENRPKDREPIAGILVVAEEPPRQPSFGIVGRNFDRVD